MKRIAIGLCLLVLTALPAQGHFIWLVPGKPAEGKPTAQAFLSDDLQPDSPEYLDKIAQTELLLRTDMGKAMPIKWARGKDAYLVTAPTPGPCVVGGVCRYGVFQRGKADPFLLIYYPKTVLGGAPFGTALFRTPCDALPLEILPIKRNVPGKFQVLWKGKPLAATEAVVLNPGQDKGTKLKTDESGTFTIDVKAPGIYGIRVGHIQDKAGEQGGKKYKAERHYATLTFAIAAASTQKTTATPIPSFPPLKQGVSSLGAAVVDGWLYVYGGHSGVTHRYSTEAVVGTFRRLKLAGGTAWEELPGGPPSQGLALVTHGGKLYRIGGMQPRNKPGAKADNHSLASAARFDPATKQWEPLPDLPSGRSSHDAVVVGDTIYVVGGWQMTGAGNISQWHSTALALDLKKQPLQWQSIPQPFHRRALTAAVHGGKIYVFGGLAEAGKAGPAVNVYDPIKAAWSSGPALPGKPRNGFSPASCVVAGRLYLSPSDGVLYRLDRSAAAWDEVGRLKYPRMVHRLVAGEGMLLAIGGASQGENAVQVEALCPAPPSAATGKTEKRPQE